MKCIKYWPESDRKTFGSIEVVLSSEEAYPDCTVRLFTIRNVRSLRLHIMVYNTLLFTFLDLCLQKQTNDLTLPNCTHNLRLSGYNGVLSHCL